LISKIWIVDRCDPVLVTIPKHAAQLPASYRHASWYHQGRVAEVDEADLTASLDAPAAAQVGRQAGLSAVRHPGVGRSHTLHCSYLLITRRSIPSAPCPKRAQTNWHEPSSSGSSWHEMAVQKVYQLPDQPFIQH
jgi:hypothetical protein